MLGFVGYAVASIVGALLAVVWHLDVLDRLDAILMPPLAFLVVIMIARAIVRQERIVFYQATCTAIIASSVISAASGGAVARVLDVVVCGIGVFLVFGRIGCFSVACCHGTPARFGIVYGHDHARAGFWRRWVGRPLWPTQLVECAVSAALVGAGLITGWNRPGLPALIYVAGYGVVRFALELVRGDSTRPYRLGLSEAQWTATMTLIGCAIVAPSALTILATLVLVCASAWLVVRRATRAPFLAPHLFEIDRACEAARAHDARQETSLGLAISMHALPDGRTDWILSGAQPWWSPDAARRLAEALWTEPELVPGRLGGVIHVLVNDRPKAI